MFGGGLRALLRLIGRGVSEPGGPEEGGHRSVFTRRLLGTAVINDGVGLLGLALPRRQRIEQPAIPHQVEVAVGALL